MKNRKDTKHELLAPPATQATHESQSTAFDLDREVIAARSHGGMTRNDVAQGMAAPQEAMTEQEAAEHEIAWFDATLDAAGFFALEHIPPIQAAMLLCGFCPHDSTESEAENCATDYTSPEDFKRLRLTFVSINKPARCSLLDWMAIAAGAGRAVHPWAQRYAKLRGLCNPAESPPTPVVAGGSSNAPLPLTTSDIAFCFDGLRWSEKEWRTPLGNKPKWLQSCVVIPGQRGVSQTRWNPVLIAAWLFSNGYVQAKSARARFQTKPQLKPWLDAWKTYEADNFDTP
ncbi:hypothetical protein E4O93_04420 [Diaphorobacter sp. DS2]|nr:hypothetical protein E4O93_04420 [Diaphorobacter sp. DS2]